MTEATQEAPVAPSTIEIQDLNQFVRMLASWHAQKVKTLKYMLTVPEGTEMTITGDETVKAALTGDMLVGFKAGIELSLIELGELPFLYETEPEEVVAPAAAAAATTDV